jgi:uncharacterized protein (TIGR03067 family)
MRALLLTVAAGLLVAADKLPEELEKLQGTWYLVSVEENGNANPKTANTRLVFKGETFAFFHGDRAGQNGGVKLDAKAKPPTMDLTSTTVKMAFIYAQEGDTLRLCYSDKGERPKEFKTKDTPGTRISTYQRKDRSCR